MLARAAASSIETLLVSRANWLPGVLERDYRAVLLPGSRCDAAALD